MKVTAKKWFYEETTHANYAKGESFEVEETIAKELEKEGKIEPLFIHKPTVKEVLTVKEEQQVL